MNPFEIFLAVTLLGVIAQLVVPGLDTTARES